MHHPSPRRAGAVLATLAVCLAGPSIADAQYFGQNKVQYEDFDFQVLESEHFAIYHYPEERQAVEQTARLAERWYARLSSLLRHELGGRQPLILYASHPHFEQTNAIPGPIGESTGGVTEGLKRRIVLPFAAGLAETDHVLGHELVHAFQFDIGRNNLQRTLRLPLWFVEGMAEYLSVGPVDPHTAMWLRDAASRDELPTIEELSSPRYFPYRYGHALWAYLAGRFGDDIVGEIFKEAGSGDAIGAIETLVRIPVEELSTQWHSAIREAYGPIIQVKRDAARAGRALITEEEGGRLNLGPALSPDGRKIVFLSERDLLSIDVYLADATTGRIERKLIETAGDPHFDSLQFINSAGAWDRSGERVVLSAVRAGQPVLVIYRVDPVKREAEIELDELGEIFSPTWSHDGRSIAFSALAGGMTDLYVYDLEAKKLRRLTSDLFADLQPAWSPDGRQLAFVTDRFSSSASTLAFGAYELAIIDVATGAMRRLPGFDRAKHINPQWSPDGGSLYFVSDPDGIANVYRLEVASGRLTPITDLLTGATGITALSPALSVAAAEPRLAFSVYTDGRYEIHTIEVPAAVSVARLPRGADAAALPPAARQSPQVAALLANPTGGLPDRAGGPVEDYSPSLQLDYVGQPYVVAGSDPLGTFVGGGVSFLFSDMLGEHTLSTVFQINGDFDDLAFQAGYINLESRWNWGAAGDQIPYVIGAFSSSLANVGGQSALVEQTTLFRQTHRRLSGIVAYPFSRAHRMEFGGGIRSISFEREEITQAFSLATGQLIAEQRNEMSAGDTINLAESSAALVYDSAVIGPTSPLVGRRYRLELSPTIGDLSYSSVLGDLRQYVMPFRPYTIAARLLHYGRYGGDAEDLRLAPAFVGYPNLVRGYDINSFTLDECRPTGSSACPAVDQLIGSRLLVANVELRFPLVGAFTRELEYGALPVEGLLFADAGVAWTADDEAAFLGGNRDFVRSVGAGVRLNALGFAVLELAAVRPLDRPGKDWMFAFNLRPGF